MATYDAKVTTNGGNLMIRSNGSLSSSIKGKIPNGAKIKISDTKKDSAGNTWGKVTYNGVSGYCCIRQVGVGTWVKLGEEVKTNKTPKQEPAKKTKKKKDKDEGTSKGIENGLEQLMDISINGGNAIKASTRLFGMPFQFANFIDSRIPKVSQLLGRKYIENIVLEAPVLTIIPGKPVYLPAAKNKQGTSQALISAANGSFSELAAVGKTMSADRLRYFDFEQDYIEYIKYVNVLCRVAAAFLEIGDTKLDGIPLAKYDWKQYRYSDDAYIAAADNIAGSIQTTTGKAVDSAAKGFKGLINGLLGNEPVEQDEQYSNKVFDDKENTSVLDSMESMFRSTNFVQFYIDPSSSFGESANNSTSTSKLEGILDQGSDLIKELAFVVNAGGGSAEDLQNFAQSSSGALADQINKLSGGGVSGFFSRILGTTSNIFGGENMIIPEIYQRSDYGKSYSIIFNLKSPYNDVFSYYMNVLVPLMHIIALICPRQSTANTYSTPFLIKAYLPGIFNCNLGIIESISIDKNSNSDGLSVDGLPTEIRVTMNIKDLYSELMITPSNDPMLFLSNSSLIDYLAVSCGLDMTKPQIANKVEYLTNVVANSFQDIPENVFGEVKKKIDDLVAPWIAIN